MFRLVMLNHIITNVIGFKLKFIPIYGTRYKLKYLSIEDISNNDSLPMYIRLDSSHITIYRLRMFLIFFIII